MKAQTSPLTASMLLLTGLASAQDALRYSWDANATAEEQRLPQALQNYTFKAGDFRLLIAPSLEQDYNDNVNLTKTDAQSDFILKPLVQFTGSYPISQQNLLTFSAGVGYDKYLEHSQYSGVRVDSTSQVMFDMRIKDFLIDFHDRVSLSEDPGTEASLAGTAEYGGLMNLAGLSITWDLEDVVLTLGYDHQNFVSSSELFSYGNHASELPLARAGFKFRPNLTVGVEGGASFTAYDQQVLNNYQTYDAGLYGDWNLGSYFRVQPRAGYTIYQLQHTSRSSIPMYYLGVPPVVSESVQTQDLNSWYVNLALSHQVSEAMSYSINAGHEITAGIQSDVTEDWYFLPSMTWMIIKDLSMQTSLFYKHGNQGEGNVTGNLTETFDWYGGELILSHPLIKNLMLRLNYRLTLRDSDIPSREYAQNIIGLRLTYQL